MWEIVVSFPILRMQSAVIRCILLYMSKQTAITTITLNPSVDFSTSAKKIRPDHKIRCAAPSRDPGGGGVNVARAVHLLGGQACAFVAVGGHMGHVLSGLMSEQGVPLHPFEIAGETRQSMAVIERRSGAQYRFVTPGPVWDHAQVSRALAEITSLAPANGLMVLSGSNPPGVPKDFAAQLMGCMGRDSCKLIVDTSGKALKQLTESTGQAPYLLRMDQAEAVEMAGQPIGSITELASFARSLVLRGVAEVVILALGAHGSVLATATQSWHAAAADVPVVSKVGAGDSFVGALSLALAKNEALPDALQKGTAAASAAVMTDATKLCVRSQVDALIAQCPVVKLD